METEGHWRLLSSVAKAWGEAEPDCILIDNQGQHHLTCRFDHFPFVLVSVPVTVPNVSFFS